MFKRILALFVLVSLTSSVQAGFMVGSLGSQYAVEEPVTEDQIYHDDKGKPESKQETSKSIFSWEYPDDVIDSLIEWSLVWAG